MNQQTRDKIFLRAFRSGTTVSFDKYVARFRTRTIGRLQVPTGRIVACDPLRHSKEPAYTRTIKPGNYPIVLSIADFPKVQRVAYAKLVIDADTPPAKWEMALVPGDDPSQLGPEDVFGYGVDAGTGCFVDEAMYECYLKAAKEDESLFDQLARMLNSHRKSAISWAQFALDDTAGNLIAFESGMGDGCYPSYFGLTKRGRVVCLLTDFYVIPWRGRTEAISAADGTGNLLPV